MNRVKLHTCFLLLLCLTLLTLSCTKKEVKEFGEYEEVSIDRMDMLVRGNCMPIELENVSVHSTIHVADEKITDLTFLTPNEIACITEEGKVFLVEIERIDVNQVADFNVSTYSWKILAHNQEEIIVCGWNIQLEPDRLEAYMIGCMNKEGDIYWYDNKLVLPSEIVLPGPVFDGEDYFFADHDDNDIYDLYMLNRDGSIEIAASNIGSARLIYPISGSPEMYWFGNWAGPLYSVKGESGYSQMSLWNSNWDTGLKPIKDQTARLIGINQVYSMEGEIGSLVILEKGDVEPVLIEYDSKLDLDLYEASSPWYPNIYCASNGDTITFTTTHYLLKYQDSELVVWHDNLQEFGDNWVTSITLESHGNEVEIRDVLKVSGLYTDYDCSHFIMVLGKAILYGGDEIETIDFDEKISWQSIQFTPDFQRACLALADGSIVVLDIEGTPVGQN